MTKIYMILMATVFMFYSCDKEVAEAIKERLESLDDFEFGNGHFMNEFETSQDALAAFSGKPSKPEFDCASFSHDSASKTVTLDFGSTPCQGKDGKKRSGIMKIQYGGNIRNPESNRVVTFNDFKVDSVLMNGIYSYTPLDSTPNNQPSVSIKIKDGSIELDNGRTISFNVDRTWVWTAGFASKDNSDDEWTVSGTCDGLAGNGSDFDIEIDETDHLLYKTVCSSSGIYYPTSGTVKIVEGRKTYTVNYGSGNCDKQAEVSLGKLTWTQELP